MTAALPEGLREALGQIIANERREWRRERELIEAQSREAVAELRARVVEFERDMEAKIAARLAELKDGEPGRLFTIDEAEPIVLAAVEKSVAALPAAKPGENGKDADPELIAEIVARAVAALPLAEKGDDADPAVIAEMVDAAVKALPAAQNGADADPEVIRQMVIEEVAKLPPPAAGPAGRDGKLPVVREWVEKVHYEGDVVSLDGSTYQAAKDTGRAPPHEDWICLAAAGRNGVDGRTPIIRGTYAEGEEYAELDIVVLNGGSFVARRDAPGPCPGDGWKLIASQGKQGKPGERGAAGPKGDNGSPGSAVVNADVDKNALVTITNGDGSTVGLDLYPLLSALR